MMAKAKELLEASLSAGQDDDNADNKLDSKNATASSTTTPAVPQDKALAAGYKYDHGIEEEEEEDLYCPYDPADEEETGTDTNNNATTAVWKTKVFCTVVRKRNPQQKHQVPYVYMLGSVLHPVHDFTKRKAYEQSLFWFTYRYDFKEIKPYGITTDAGWGCMLRSAQMLLAHTLRLHFSESLNNLTTTTNNNNNNTNNRAFHNRLLTWFVDLPSTDRCFYSLHNMCAAGLAKHQVLPGEWYGPGTACYVLRDLVHMHQEQQPSTPLFRVHVATEGTVYRQVVEELMTRDARKRRQEQEKQQTQSPSETVLPAHPLDPLATEAEASINDSTTYSATMEWDTSMLLLIPLRLGLNNFHPDYVQSLARCFALPQSVGILGGRPRGARWFYGALADGSQVLGLDPHTVQPSLTSLPAKGTSQEAPLPEDFLASVHTQYPDTFDLARMDPSIALGFYCRTRRDLEALEESLKQIDTVAQAISQQQLVAFMDQAPNYEDNFDIEDDDGLTKGLQHTQAPGADDDDEDDFVFL